MPDELHEKELDKLTNPYRIDLGTEHVLRPYSAIRESRVLRFLALPAGGELAFVFCLA